MREAEFRAWLEAQGYAQNTVATRLADARRVERHYGDLDAAFDRDWAASVSVALAYSTDDRRAGRPNPSTLAIDGDLYNSLASYRAAVTAYGRFRTAADGIASASPEKLPLSSEDILAAVGRHDAAGGLDAYLAGLPGLGRPHQYWLVIGGERYPSKAIVNDAYRRAGGDNEAKIGGSQSKALLDALGFVVIDWPAFEASVRTFASRMSPFNGFREEQGGYWEIERRYKNEVIAQVRALAAGAEDDATAGAAIVRALTTGRQGLPLSWRTLGEVDAADPALRSRFYTIVGRLARSGADGEQAIADAARGLEALRDSGVAGLRRGEVLSIANTVWATVHPDQASWFKISRVEAMGRRLFDRRLFAHDRFDPADLAEYLGLLHALFGLLDRQIGWEPDDLFDVQGFVWVALDDGWGDDAAAEALVDATDAIALSGQKNMPTNLILYGPPGTGKTYATARHAVRLCGEETDGLDRNALMARYKALSEAGRIEFVTFHQSTAYEEFVEGLRPVQAAEGSAGFELQPMPGVFRRIAAVAEQARHARTGGEPLDLTGRQVFKMSLGRAGAEDHIYDAAVAGDYVVLGWGGDVDWSGPEFDGKTGWQAIFDRWKKKEPDANGYNPNVVQTWRFRTSMRPGDLVVVSEGNSRFRGIAEVTGPYRFDPTGEQDYNHRRDVRWLVTLDQPLPVETIYDKQFSQQSCYLLSEAHLKREALARLLPGEVAPETAQIDQFVLVIDEINRANISKVFGELITLLEADKRIGAANELRVRLPYSGDTFGVPANLHIVGTMNTADRSIALLDTALRRRFTFEELMPDPKLLTTVEGIDLQAVLTTLNDRIEYLFDREHQIGHAYFLPCRTRDDVHDVMRHKVIPLLQEYFYEDWTKVAAVLGDVFEDNGRTEEGGFLIRTPLASPFGKDEDEGRTRYRWTVRAPATFTYARLGG